MADWRAFAAGHLFGLDPERRYPIASQAPDPKSLHLVSASQPIIVQEVRDNRRRALFRLGGQTAVVADFVELAVSAAAGILVEGRQEPISAGAGSSATPGVCGGEALPSISAHPPWLGGKLGGLTYGEFQVPVPPEGHPLLRFAIGLGDLTEPAQIEADAEQPVSDGVTFIVSVDGQEVFREHWLRGKWGRREVDLAPYRGQSVIVRLATGRGPANKADWDWAVWGQPRVVNPGSAETQPLKLQLFSPYGEATACFGDPDQPGRVVATRPADGDGVLLDFELPRAQPFGMLYETTPAAAGADLADLPFSTGSTAGGVLQEGSIYGSGTVGPDQVDGATCRAINGHFPNAGRTALDWCLQLPPEPVRLSFHAKVRPGGGPVAFEVQVNGQSLWALPMPYPDGWKEGAVDLGPWKGKPVLLSLVTDSVGSNLCGWAAWADVRLVAP